MSALPGSELLGLGAAQPTDVLTGSELGQPFGKSAEWIRARTGITALRRVGAPDELAGLASRAAAEALAAAGLPGDAVDLVIDATCSRPAGLGDSAPFGADQAPRAGRMTINAACSGFCYALQTADNLIRTGSVRHVLVVAAERMSQLLDPDDLGTSIIFGDGAGAAVIGPSESDRPGIGPSVMGSDGSQHGLIQWEAGGFLRMAGQEVFRWAVEHMPGVARAACRRADLGLGDIDVFVPHQANLRIIDAITRTLALEPRVVVADDVSLSGNTSAASIPIALTGLLETGRARAGQLALLVGFGAGLSYAAQVVRLPDHTPSRPRRTFPSVDR
ncbi:MAG TPA: beta-ketoacyl-ACP synthase 3 [Jatrophihabitans sp.]|nr:beta-ketoacyl-ACP synthase 3 [Jatrophihabitans sp.]